jgi:hypothetical protein
MPPISFQKSIGLQFRDDRIPMSPVVNLQDSIAFTTLSLVGLRSIYLPVDSCGRIEGFALIGWTFQMERSLAVQLSRVSMEAASVFSLFVQLTGGFTTSKGRARRHVQWLKF